MRETRVNDSLQVILKNPRASLGIGPFYNVPGLK